MKRLQHHHHHLLLSATLWAGCDTASLPGSAADVPAGTLRGEVHYAGAQRGPLKIAVFATFPPVGAPLAHQELTQPRFPQPFSIPGLMPGRYFVLALVDVDPTDGDRLRPLLDPGGAYGGFAAPLALTVDGSAAPPAIRIELQDPGADSPWSRLNYR